MAFSERASALKSVVAQTHKHEAAGLLAASWNGKVTAQQNALALVRLSKKRLDRMIDSAESLPPADSGMQEAREVLGTMQLDMVETLMKTRDSIENRLAKLSHYETIVKEQSEAYGHLEKSPVLVVSESLKNFIDKAKTISTFLLDVVKEPMKYAKIALDFINGKTTTFMVKYLSKALGWTTSKVASALGKTIPQADEAAAYSAYLWASGGADLSRFPKIVKLMEKLVKYLKIAAVCVTAVTTFFSEMARRGSWANAVAKGATMGAFTALTISTSTVLAATVTSTLTAALPFVEVPPLAGVILAAGLVIVAGIAVAELFDLLITACFGNLTIAPSMRLPMSVSVVSQMKSSMSSPMTSSMLPD